METFKIGDVVVLKSGGPKMTINEDAPDEDNTIECVYFEGEKRQHKTFHVETLMKVSEEN